MNATRDTTTTPSADAAKVQALAAALGDIAALAGQMDDLCFHFVGIVVGNADSSNALVVVLRNALRTIGAIADRAEAGYSIGPVRDLDDWLLSPHAANAARAANWGTRHRGEA